MDFDEEKAKLYARLSAHQHLLAFALASALQGHENPKNALNAGSAHYIERWRAEIERETKLSSPHKALIASAYNREMRLIMKNAAQLLQEMKGAS